MILTPEQMQHLNSVIWLFSDKRAVGKTTLILYALLLKAIEYPNMQIHIVDHFPMNQAIFETVIMPTLKAMIEDPEFKDFNFIINKNNRTIIRKERK